MWPTGNAATVVRDFNGGPWGDTGVSPCSFRSHTPKIAKCHMLQQGHQNSLTGNFTNSLLFQLILSCQYPVCYWVPLGSSQVFKWQQSLRMSGLPSPGSFYATSIQVKCYWIPKPRSPCAIIKVHCHKLIKIPSGSKIECKIMSHICVYSPGKGSVYFKISLKNSNTKED